MAMSRHAPVALGSKRLEAVPEPAAIILRALEPRPQGSSSETLRKTLLNN